MIVPGHVVFLWRIIHQHFTLAFLEHISSCRWNKPSWPFQKVASFGQNKSNISPQFSGAIAATHLRSAFRSFGYFCSSKSRRLSPQTAYSFTEVPGAGRAELCGVFFNHARFFVSVWRALGAFLRRLDHLDLKPSLLPYPPLAPVPSSCHGRRRKGSYVSSLANASTERRIHAK